MKFRTEEITNYNEMQLLFQPKILLVIFPFQYKLLYSLCTCKASSVHGIYLMFKFFLTMWYVACLILMIK